MTSYFLFLRALVKQGKECLCRGRSRQEPLHVSEKWVARRCVKISMEQLTFPVIPFPNTNCTASASPLLGAERSLDIFLSHFPLHVPHLFLHQPCPSRIYLTSFPHPKTAQPALVSHPHTSYTLLYNSHLFAYLKNSVLKWQVFISKRLSCHHSRRKKSLLVTVTNEVSCTKLNKKKWYQLSQ